MTTISNPLFQGTIFLFQVILAAFFVVFLCHSNVSFCNSKIIVILLRNLKSLYGWLFIFAGSQQGRSILQNKLKLTSQTLFPPSVSLNLTHSFKLCQPFYFLCLKKPIILTIPGYPLCELHISKKTMKC